MCFCLKVIYIKVLYIYKKIYIYLYCWFHYHWTHYQQHYKLIFKAYLTWIFFIRHIMAFLHLGTLDSILALHSGPILSSKVPPPKRHKSAKNSSTIRLFILCELKQEGRASPSSTSAENGCMWWLKLLLFCSCLQMTTLAISVNIGITNFSK